MKKKLLSLAVVLAMALTLLPTAAFAAQTPGDYDGDKTFTSNKVKGATMFDQAGTLPDVETGLSVEKIAADTANGADVGVLVTHTGLQKHAGESSASDPAYRVGIGFPGPKGATVAYWGSSQTVEGLTALKAGTGVEINDVPSNLDTSGTIPYFNLYCGPVSMASGSVDEDTYFYVRVLWYENDDSGALMSDTLYSIKFDVTKGLKVALKADDPEIVVDDLTDVQHFAPEITLTGTINDTKKPFAQFKTEGIEANDIVIEGNDTVKVGSVASTGDSITVTLAPASDAVTEISTDPITLSVNIEGDLKNASAYNGEVREFSTVQVAITGPDFTVEEPSGTPSEEPTINDRIPTQYEDTLKESAGGIAFDRDEFQEAAEEFVANDSEFQWLIEEATNDGYYGLRAEPDIVIVVKDYEPEVTYTVDITPVVNLVGYNKRGEEETYGSVAMHNGFSKKISVTVPIPAGLAGNGDTVYVNHDRDPEIPCVVRSGKIEFDVKAFSAFTISTTSSGKQGGIGGGTGTSSGSGGSGVRGGTGTVGGGSVSTPVTTPVDSTPSAPSTVGGFSDVPTSNTFATEIAWAQANGIMGGYSDGTFRPGNNTTRQALWMVLARLAGANPGNDMAAARQWAIENGISDGSNPDSALSRQQLITMLYRVETASGATPTVSSDLSAFADGGLVAGYAKEAMAWGAANGIITGNNGNLNPEGPATRAHFVAFLYRYANLA